MTTRPFLVAGGGIAGLSAALGLASAGRDVRLFEQAPAFEEVGAGLQMSPNGVRALRALGAWEAVEPACVIPSEIHVRDGQSGGLLQRIRLGKPFEERFGAPYRVCHRADLLAGLLATAKASACVSLATAHRVTRIDTTGNEVTLGFASGQTEAGDAAIGADGIRSTLRQAVCGDVVPSPSGHAIYRGLLPLANVPADIEADSVTLWLCRGGHVVHYPVSNWRSFNIVAAADADAADAGWGKEAGGSDVLARFRDCADMLAGLLAAPVSWFGWQGADLPQLPAWTKGPLLLLGDAAHATLPYLAQGAVMAIEDAAVLSRELKTGNGTAEVFARVAEIRRPRTMRIQAQSRRMGQIYHARGPVALARNAALRLSGDRLALSQTEWIYRWTP